MVKQRDQTASVLNSTSFTWKYLIALGKWQGVMEVTSIITHTHTLKACYTQQQPH
ncbi:MAG: hypothetical protein V7L02_10340 [Nostoc sp.]|uniref:hypothetical protein n=1 Tax=Nostoc sp. TaxID=1180 RepID=UPI002FFD36CE